MDLRTLAFYAANAQKIAKRYELVNSPLSAQFAVAFKPGGRILDVGCGSGRDLAELRRQGFDAYGVDGTPALVELAQDLHPELRERVVNGLLPHMPIPFGGDFDGVLCCAVLMHIDAAALRDAVLTLQRCLKLGGRMLVSLPCSRSDAGACERDENGRLFAFHQPEDLRELFQHAGFSLLDVWKNDDTLQRQNVRWYSHLYALTKGQN